MFPRLASALALLLTCFVAPYGGAVAADSSASPIYKRLPEGPWGSLEAFPLLLEPSDFLVSQNPDLRLWSQGTVWEFAAKDQATVRSALAESGLKEEWIERLLSDEHLKREGNLFEVRPPPEILLGVSAEQRALLYRRFSPRDEDSPYTHPYSLLPGGIRSGAPDDTGVSEEKLQLIEKLSYQNGLVTRFSDINYLFSQTPDDGERWRILKTLMRERSLIVQLRITPSMDLALLADYWTSRGKNKEILPMFESVVSTPGVDRIDLAHLLPPLPRRLLHTYPDISVWRIGADAPDCFWTSFNFFSSEPANRHLDFVGHVFEARYERAERPYQLGDLILVIDQTTGKWVHACNYIAANLVFTKNGHSGGRPWVIQSLDDVVRGYVSTEKASIGFFRLRPEYRR